QKFSREEVPRGDAQLMIRRGDVESVVSLPPGYLTGVYRPAMPRDVEPSYLEAKKKIDAKDLEGGVAAFRELARYLAGQREYTTASWLLARSGDLRFGTQKWSDAVALYDAAIEAARSAGDSVA